MSAAVEETPDHVQHVLKDINKYKNIKVTFKHLKTFSIFNEILKTSHISDAWWNFRAAQSSQAHEYECFCFM